MSETLTIDTNPQTETATDSIENLTPDEQESLAVGEELQNQQDELLAGKYKDAQELEKAYVELEKKLGKENPETEEDSQEPPEAKEETPESNILDDLWDQATSGKEYNKETLEALNKMSATDLANMHLEYRKANQAQPAKRDLTQQEVNELQGVVGGKENYGNMMKWAQQNLTEQEVQMFDTVMERGDPLSAFFAVRSLAYRYNDTIGYDGKMLTGNAPKANTDVYKSQAQVVEAMSDPRYDRDTAYRQEVMEKLSRSNIDF